MRARRSAARAASFHRSWRRPSATRWSAASRLLLFLNRRGFRAADIVRRACGFRLQCPNCDAWLVDHRFQETAGRAITAAINTKPPEACPNCHATESFAAVGPGVERLEQEARRSVSRTSAFLFCRAISSSRWSVCARNSTMLPRAVSTSSSARSLSPRVTISPSSIWSASSMRTLGLGNGDPRAAERTFQLLHQVVGRAGRERPIAASACLQTHQPEHPVMKALDPRRPRGVLFQ